jgi:hypothetical protein
MAKWYFPTFPCDIDVFGPEQNLKDKLPVYEEPYAGIWHLSMWHGILNGFPITCCLGADGGGGWDPGYAFGHVPAEEVVSDMDAIHNGSDNPVMGDEDGARMEQLIFRSRL